MVLRFQDNQGIQALDTNQLIELIRGNSIVDTDNRFNVTVDTGTLGQGDTLQVESGTALVGGSEASNNSTQSVQIDAADADNPRKDVVFIDSNGAAQVAKGTPEDPEPEGAQRFDLFQPAPPARNNVDGAVIAEVFVGAGSTSVSTGDLRDRRLFGDAELASLNFRSGYSPSSAGDAATKNYVDTEVTDSQIDVQDDGTSVLADAEALNFKGGHFAASDDTGGVAGVDISAGSLENSLLVNSSVTVDAGDGLKSGGSVSLGGSVGLDVEPADFAGSFVSDDGADNLTVDIGTGLAGDGSGNIAVDESGVDHDALQNFVSDEHVDHSAVNVSSGAGLSGGGDITSDVTLSLDAGTSDLNDAASPNATTAGQLLIFDATDSQFENSTLTGGGGIGISNSDASVTLSVSESGVDHDALQNFVSNEHVDHSAVSVTGTGALTGGGDLTSSRSIDVAVNGVGTSELDESAAFDFSSQIDFAGGIGNSGSDLIINDRTFIEGLRITGNDNENTIYQSNSNTTLALTTNGGELTLGTGGGGKSLFINDTDEVVVNRGNLSSIDFKVNTDGVNDAFFVDAGNDLVNVNTDFDLNNNSIDDVASIDGGGDAVNINDSLSLPADVSNGALQGPANTRQWLSKLITAGGGNTGVFWDESESPKAMEFQTGAEVPLKLLDGGDRVTIGDGFVNLAASQSIQDAGTDAIQFDGSGIDKIRDKKDRRFSINDPGGFVRLVSKDYDIDLLTNDASFNDTKRILVNSGSDIVDVDIQNANLDLNDNLIIDPSNNTTADSMTANPETDSEDGFIEVEINGTTRQIPFYDQ